MISKVGRIAALILGTTLAISAQAQLNMGIIPAENNEQAVSRFEPIRKDLEEQLGQSIRVFQATDYSGIVEAMRRGRVDFAWFGPASGMLAYQQANAVPFAVGVSADTGEATYHSTYMTLASNKEIHSMADLEGRNVAFVDPASASGGLVPTYMLMQEFDRMPEDFFGRFIYAGTHDAAVMALVNGSVEASAVADFVFDNMVNRGLVNRDDFRIIKKSEPVPGPPLMIRGDLPDSLKEKVTKAMTTMHERIETVVGLGDYSHYRESSLDEYQLILDMMDAGLM